jgi:hypothetical protein
MKPPSRAGPLWSARIDNEGPARWSEENDRPRLRPGTSRHHHFGGPADRNDGQQRYHNFERPTQATIAMTPPHITWAVIPHARPTDTQSLLSLAASVGRPARGQDPSSSCGEGDL